MGGEGSMNGMIISLKNNNQLRRRRCSFKAERSLFSSEPKTSTGNYHPIEIKKLSKEELSYYRNITREQHRRRFLKSLLFFILTLGALSVAILLFLYS